MAYNSNARLQKISEAMNGGDAARERYLAQLLTQGTQAETITEFLNAWMDTEAQQVLDRLEDDSIPAETIRNDYKAAIRLYDYISSVIDMANVKRKQLSKGE